MPKSVAFDTAVLSLLFNQTSITNICTSTGVTSLYCSLHTSDPSVSNAIGSQSVNEVTYTGYARTAIARTIGGFTVSGNSVSPVANITFPAGTAGSGTATYAAFGTAASGAGVILYSGAISPSIVCGNGVTPVITTSSTISES